MKRIGVISDTHTRSGPATLPPRLLQAWGHIDLLLHAGDITSPALLDALNQIAETVAVAGNNDGSAILATCPRRHTLHMEQCQIGIIHGDAVQQQLLSDGNALRRPFTLHRLHQALRSQFPTAHGIVYGHTHQPICVRENGILFFNPGACSLRDGNLAGSVGILTIEGACMSGEIIYF